MILGVGELEGPAAARDAGNDDDFDWDFDAAIPPTDSGYVPKDDGSDGVVSTRRRVFVTSGVFAASFGGVDGGHSKCQEAAMSAGLGGEWVAWLSGNGTKAADALPSDGPYELVTGTPIAPTKAALLTGLTAPINVVEDGGQAPTTSIVWTGTRKDGQAGETCVNWTDKSLIKLGTAGSLDQKDGRWIDNGGQPLVSTQGWTCNTGGRLYCFER